MKSNQHRSTLRVFRYYENFPRQNIFSGLFASLASFRFPHERMRNEEKMKQISYFFWWVARLIGFK